MARYGPHSCPMHAAWLRTVGSKGARSRSIKVGEKINRLHLPTRQIMHPNARANSLVLIPIMSKQFMPVGRCGNPSACKSFEHVVLDSPTSWGLQSLLAVVENTPR